MLKLLKVRLFLFVFCFYQVAYEFHWGTNEFLSWSLINPNLFIDYIYRLYVQTKVLNKCSGVKSTTFPSELYHVLFKRYSTVYIYFFIFIFSSHKIILKQGHHSWYKNIYMNAPAADLSRGLCLSVGGTLQVYRKSTWEIRKLKLFVSQKVVL